MVTTFFPVSCLIEVVSSFFGWLRQTFTSRCPITHFVRRLVFSRETRMGHPSPNSARKSHRHSAISGLQAEGVPRRNACICRGLWHGAGEDGRASLILSRDPQERMRGVPCSIWSSSDRYQTPGISLYRTLIAKSLYPFNSSCNVWSSHCVRTIRTIEAIPAGINAHKEPNESAMPIAWRIPPTYPGCRTMA